MFYFFDETNKYIGCRACKDNEQIPQNATTVSVVLGSGEQAHFIKDKWIVSTIPLDSRPESLPQPPTLEERVTATETDVDGVITVLAIIEGVV